ncbi:histamine N-methyltransferase-like [Acanthaster planci]|uniref:Histamine N-methyltransferase-like n=1 Tax=Acanthaster planci TaxID=133434 RepID=A0A8B7XHL6_ACAPL|nr:histamine N-methyltransferase-like [Acanthaster planci]XP_022080287.1 histamine N-methyltransferase-like [Acanthaster planci]XP_022080288.1 histamine N-methyltransferase-like [Acanthaster planci]XP_022080289.1 histamine N-methyltransferase-like [Acanthaster planci]
MESILLPSLYDCPDRLGKSYEIFCSRSAKFSEYSDWVDKVFSEAVVCQLQTTLDGQEELQVLGVGSGSGMIDYAMLRKLLQRFPRINNRVVEPDQEELKKYKALVQSKARELRGVTCDWREQTIEQYQKAGELKKFHFISTIHCLYHVDDLDSSLTYLYDCLERGGVMLVSLSSDASGRGRFQNRLQSVHGKCPLFTTRRSSADVRSFFDRRGTWYTQLPIPRRLNITECFDEASAEGELLTDFLTTIAHFKQTAPKELQQSVMESLGSNDCCERIGGQVWLDVGDDALITKRVETT